MFNAIDYVIVFIVLISTIAGTTRGFISSFFSFCGWVFGFFITYEIFPITESFLVKKGYSETMIFLIGYPFTFLLLILIFAVSNFFIIKVLKPLIDVNIDRIIGCIFGLLRGVFINLFLFLIFSILVSISSGLKYKNAKKGMPDILSKSYSFPYISTIHDAIIIHLPNSIYNKLFEINKDE